MKFEYNLKSPAFTVENIAILNVSRDRGYKNFYRDRTKHGFIYTVSGLMCYTFKQKHIYIQTGEVIFIPKGCTYSGTYFKDGTEIKIVQFDIASGVLPDYLSIPQKINFPGAVEQINAFFKPMKNHTNGHPFYYLSCLYSFLQQIDDCCSKIPSKYKKLSAALSELSEHYYQNEKISYYAELCGMSEAGFRRLFREYMGQSPVEYRNELRLNNAKIKLQSGEYNVSEAAEATGFSNLSFFIRLYKKKYGYTPKKE